MAQATRLACPTDYYSLEAELAELFNMTAAFDESSTFSLVTRVRAAHALPVPSPF